MQLGLIIAVLSLAHAACDSVDSVVEVGRIERSGGTHPIHVPASADVGRPVVVTVTTVGDGCVSFESTEVETSTDGVDITPYDRRQIGEGCLLLLYSFPHEAVLTFDSPGKVDARVHVRRYSGEIETFPYQITVA